MRARRRDRGWQPHSQGRHRRLQPPVRRRHNPQPRRSAAGLPRRVQAGRADHVVCRLHPLAHVPSTLHGHSARRQAASARSVVSPVADDGPASCEGLDCRVVSPCQESHERLRELPYAERSRRHRIRRGPGTVPRCGSPLGGPSECRRALKLGWSGRVRPRTLRVPTRRSTSASHGRALHARGAGRVGGRLRGAGAKRRCHGSGMRRRDVCDAGVPT